MGAASVSQSADRVERRRARRQLCAEPAPAPRTAAPAQVRSD